MPFAVYLLGLAVFAQGTSEFMLSGLVPGIARDLAVPVPAAGLLTSAFAAGMVVGAPLMALLSLRWSRRRSLLSFLLLFVGVHVVGALTASYGVLLATRVVAALANAGFLAVALATATTMAAPHARGRATAVLLGGITLACVAGVPGGALLGQLWGWRAAFWAVAVVSAPAVVAVLRSVPADPPGAPVPSPRGELRALRNRHLLWTLLLGVLVNGATFCTFTYLAPMVTALSGMGPLWIPVVLALFGIGSFLGVTLAGRLADTQPRRVLLAGGAALPAGWTLFALTASWPEATIILVVVQGALSFAVGSTLIAQALSAAAEAPTLAGGVSTAAFNVGAALGPWLGGLAIGAEFGYRAPLWVGAGLALLAFAVASAVRAGSPVPRR